MVVFGPSRAELWHDFLVQLGRTGLNAATMDDEARALALERGERLFEFISQIDKQTWNELDELYRSWLKRTGRGREGWP